MQPLSGHGVQVPPSSSPPSGNGPVLRSDEIGEQPLTPAQRTTLERLIVKIMSMTPLKSAELWAGLRHDLGLKHDASLLAQHFPAAEQFLTAKLTQSQEGHATRQLLQSLTELLPQGNNRQAVSDFIRQQFGHTVLSALSPEQLRQVLTMLQNGQMTIPQPQQNHITDRTLLPAEQHALTQQVARLAATTGDPPARLWSSVLEIVNLHSGDPVPSRFFPLLTQYLQVRQTISQQSNLSLTSIISLLKVPAAPAEQQALEQACEQRFQLPPQATLTATQALDLVNLLFIRGVTSFASRQFRAT
ncbi:MAG: Flagellar regulator flk [Candidatus Erwinia impunctatus]|nr:Flagellar regulator flk [Culicoides impunctatus]